MTLFNLKYRIISLWQTVNHIFVDYAAHSTIHGVNYFAEKGRSWFEKVWWIAVFGISILCCGNLILDVWNISPIIISFKDKPTPIWELPFPAITICPMTFARTDDINITQLILQQNNGVNLFQSLPETK
jgi:acid-sensing ion channel, other